VTLLSDRAIRACREQFRLACSPAGAGPAVLEVVLDASLSMTSSDGAKEQLARELAALLLDLAADAGLRATVLAARGTGRNRSIDATDSARLFQLPFDGCQTLAECVRGEYAGLAHAAVRIVVSDFLFPDDPNALIEQLAMSADRLFVVQLLDDAELHPTPTGWIKLCDIETEETIELEMHESAIAEYTARLEALRDTLARACAGAPAATFVTVCAADGLERICIDHLLPAGLLQRAAVASSAS
jgi:uncharacterized protein (DUF58 family)